MARKSKIEIVPVTRETATMIPLLKEVRDFTLDEGKTVRSYLILSEDRKLTLGTVGRIWDAIDPKSGKPVVSWTATAGGAGTGLPKRTVKAAASRKLAIEGAIIGAYSAA